MAPCTLIHSIGQLVTLGPLATSGRRTRIGPADLGIIANAWLAIGEDGTVTALGSGTPPAEILAHASRVSPPIDAQGGLVLPGLVDSHTHLLWAGSRAQEMVRRLEGETYASIAASGGGIMTTVRATRQASHQELKDLTQGRLRRLLSLGTTTVEVKSGYGLSVEEELRHLRILAEIRAQAPQKIAITCLALHALSPEYAGNLQGWVQAATDQLLPQVAGEGLADAADAFIEPGYFSVAEATPYLRKAQELGLKLRLHADEFADAGAALAAATLGAHSADHLQQASARGMAAMARANVTATLLPGTSLYTRLPFTQGRLWADAGVPVAIASDFNPGSCLLDNLPMLASLAAVHGGLTPAEVVAGITYVPACSLGLGTSKGALTPGYDGDLVIYRDLPDLDHWIADFGRTLPTQVLLRGKAAL